MQKSVLDLPEVKKAIAFAMTPQGLALGAGLGAAGVTALAANHQPLPFQPPAIPLDRIGLKGVGAKVTLDGPVDRPTGVGIALTYTEQGPRAKKGASDTDKLRAETARLRADQDRFRAGLRPVPGSAAARQQAADDRDTQEAVARFVAGRSALPGVGRPLIPATGATPAITTPPAPAAAPQPEQKPDDAPVQRTAATTGEHASAAATSIDTSRVDDAVRGSGRPLEPAVRRSMESRFGYDFSHVRLHDDGAATAAARDTHASAFTVGSDIVLGSDGPDPRMSAGRHLLAHELAHVVQQSDGRAGGLQRKALGVSSPYDPAEREADAAADRVLAGTAAFPDRAPSRQDAIGRDADDAEGGTPGPDGWIYPPLEDDPWPDASDPTADGREVQASRADGPGSTPAGFGAALARSGAGSPLPGDTRAAMERGFATPFGGVRVHRDAHSDALAASIGARAFTWGSDIHLARSAPPASSTEGRHLLAHELCHVVQQSSSPRTRRVHRSRALFMSTVGRPGYFRFAARFHRDHGFPAPVDVSSIEELVEHLVALPKPIESVRLVTHAVPAGIFLPLLRGGGTSLFQADLGVQTQSALEGELSTEHATIGHDNHQVTVDHHLLPHSWAADVFTGLATDPTWRRFRDAQHLPTTLASGGDLETFLWWIADRELLTARRPTTGPRGQTSIAPVVRMSEQSRGRAAGSIERNVGIFRSRVRDHLALRLPQNVADDQRQATAAIGAAELERRAVSALAPLIDRAIANQSLGSLQVSQPTPRYDSIQGALERGTFTNNLLAAKVAIGNGMPFEIRGCRIGQNTAWLDAFRDLWGVGQGAPPGGHRPDVSAPDLRHIFGLIPVGRGRAAHLESAEWLEGPRGRRIRGGTSEFDQHIVHST